jgi:hypothetical protein
MTFEVVSAVYQRNSFFRVVTLREHVFYLLTDQTLRTASTWYWRVHNHTRYTTKPGISVSHKNIYLSFSYLISMFRGSVQSLSSRLEMSFLDISRLEDNDATLPLNAGFRTLSDAALFPRKTYLRISSASSAKAVS